MDFLSLCKTRYSVRNFMSKKPEKAAIEYIMECVRMAPSAVNFQPWKFNILRMRQDWRSCANVMPEIG